MIEFKFNVKDHWIRSFVYQDDSRRTMWVCKVLAKKQNKLTNAEVAVLTAIYKAKTLEEKEFNKKH